MTSRSEYIKNKCRSCGYDKNAPGTFLEQIAVCPVMGCELRPARPMPRQCRKDGIEIEEAIEAIDAKLKAIDHRWFLDGR